MNTENPPTFTPCYETADREIPFLIYFEIIGGIYAFPYGHLLDVHSSLSGGGAEIITLRFSTTVVSIEGKNLQKILRNLGLQKLQTVRMVPSHHLMSKSKSEPIVTKITIKRNGDQHPEKEKAVGHDEA